MEGEKPRKERRRRLTPKQQKLVKERLKNPNASLSELALQSHYTARQTVHATLNKPQVAATIQEAIAARQELSKNSLAEIIVQGIQATKKSWHGQELTEKEQPDFLERRQMTELVLKLTGELKPAESPQVTINNFMDSLSDEELALIGVGKKTIAELMAAKSAAILVKPIPTYPQIQPSESLEAGENK